MTRTGWLETRLSLTVITDPRAAGDRGVVSAVRAALEGGAPAVQLRAKHESARETVELAHQLRIETRRTGALFFVNDRVDVAMAADADGVHVGDDDIPVAAARRITPPAFLIGRSADTPAQARQAELEGADYVGVGPVFETASKLDAGPAIGLAGIEATRASVRIPVVAIGGIDAENAAGVVTAGADGVAVIRAVMASRDPASAVREILDRIRTANRAG